MNKNKLVLTVLLTVFIMGMIVAPVAASHTYKKGGYKFTVSNSLYKKINIL